MEQNPLVSRPLPVLFGQFVGPAMVAMVLDGIQGMVDGLFLGRYAGPDAMASVNIANPFFQIIIGSTMILCTGTMSAAGRALGAQDYSRAKNLYRSALAVLLALSGTILLTGVLFARPIARFLGANEVLLPGAARYVQIIACFAPVIAFKIFFGFSGRLAGRPRLYLAGTITTLCTNVLLDWVAVGLLGLGVTGAVTATGLAYLAGMLVAAPPLFHRSSPLNVFEGSFRGREIFFAACNGASEGVTYVSAALTVFLMNRAMMSFAGEDGVAAFTVINYAGNFVTLLMFGMSDGISPILSSNFGAGRLDRIRRTKAAALAGNFCIGLCLCLLFSLGGRQLIGLFFTPGDPRTSQVMDLAVRGARIYSLSFLASGFNIVQSGYHTALGDALRSVTIAASRGIVFLPIGLAVFSALFQENGVWMAPLFAEAITVVVCLLLRRIPAYTDT